jgi:carbamoyl-phosphate synthase large subunit
VEETAGTLTFECRCEASIVMRRDLRDGNTYHAYVEAFPELNVEARLVEAVGSHGPANFQFRLNAQGRAKVFEINGQFSGATPLRMRAGFNEVEMVLRQVIRGEPIKQPSVHPMTILRHFTETVVPAGATDRSSRGRDTGRGLPIDRGVTGQLQCEPPHMALDPACRLCFAEGVIRCL